MFRVLALLLLTASAHAVEVRDARILSDAGKQRVVLDLSGRTSHRLSTLSNPDRLVIDLDHTRARLARFRALGAEGSVKSVRAAARGKDGLRVVVDLGRHVRARSFFRDSTRGTAAQLVIEWRESAAECGCERICSSARGSRRTGEGGAHRACTAAGTQPDHRHRRRPWWHRSGCHGHERNA